MSSISIPKKSSLIEISVSLPSSKSESNRALIMQALSKEAIVLDNLSPARDTQTMMRLLKSTESTLDVLDAGTTMRFLTAYLAITNQQKTLTGTERMQQRPIGTLVDALRAIGAEISYVQKEGFPPLHIQGFQSQKVRQIQIRGDISSQYISALLMIAPLLPEGLNLELTGKIGSRPYIDMTLGLMKHFGITSNFEGSRIEIRPQAYRANQYTIESDWSAASYWYSYAALAEEAELTLLGLRKTSFQGDIRIAGMMHVLGVASIFHEDGVQLVKTEPRKGEFHFDFADCPDLAQTIAVVAAAKGVTIKMSGLESLRIKETDRIAALQNELAKIGASMTEVEDGIWLLRPSANTDWQQKNIEIETYEDHRMAMAFAPLCMLTSLVIHDPQVVNKSYPGYWDDLKKAGIQIQ